jgi:hypothetical protein
LELQPRFYSFISKGAAGPMEGKKIATPSSKTGKKSDVSTKSKSEYCSFLFAFFILQISRDLHPRINALNLS